MADQIVVNNNQISWGSIILKVRAERFYGFTGISFADKRERVKGYGQGRHHAPRGRSAGKYSVENVKLTGWKASVQQLRQELALQSLAPGGYGDVEFEIDVQYIEADEMPIQVLIERCVWAGNSTSDEESPDPLKEEIEIDCMLIRRNGLVLFDSRMAI
jgi:hypothetical protein